MVYGQRKRGHDSFAASLISPWIKRSAREGLATGRSNLFSRTHLIESAGTRHSDDRRFACAFLSIPTISPAATVAHEVCLLTHIRELTGHFPIRSTLDYIDRSRLPLQRD